MMARLLGLLSKERLANEMSAVTRVIVILQKKEKKQFIETKCAQKINHKMF